MDIHLSPEDQRRIDELVAAGRFTDVSDAVHAGIEALEEDESWRKYAQERIEHGLDDIKAGRVVSGEQVLERLHAARLKRA
jgi:putative addiction module CopG family antidote